MAFFSGLIWQRLLLVRPPPLSRYVVGFLALKCMRLFPVVQNVLLFFPLAIKAATKCDSMTLTPGPWLGLPAVPAVTLYRHEDPALVS